jgi:hypothetical protein
MMKKTFTACLSFFCFACVSMGFEGVIHYSIASGGRNWEMRCLVKGEWLRAEVFMGEQHYQTLLNQAEGQFLVDELNRQVFQTDLERHEWGKKDRKESRKKRDDYELAGQWSRDALSGELFKIKADGKDFRVEHLRESGVMPDVFLDQFASLRPVFLEGAALFRELPGMPHRIYTRKHPDQPILWMTLRQERPVDDASFAVPEGYVRGKFLLRMR